MHPSRRKVKGVGDTFADKIPPTPVAFLGREEAKVEGVKARGHWESTGGARMAAEKVVVMPVPGIFQEAAAVDRVASTEGEEREAFNCTLALLLLLVLLVVEAPTTPMDMEGKGPKSSRYRHQHSATATVPAHRSTAVIRAMMRGRRGW